MTYHACSTPREPREDGEAHVDDEVDVDEPDLEEDGARGDEDGEDHERDVPPLLGGARAPTGLDEAVVRAQAVRLCPASSCTRASCRIRIRARGAGVVSSCVGRRWLGVRFHSCCRCRQHPIPHLDLRHWLSSRRRQRSGQSPPRTRRTPGQHQFPHSHSRPEL